MENDLLFWVCQRANKIKKIENNPMFRSLQKLPTKNS